MSNHFCLDPNDPYAQSEVLVFFEGRYPDIRLLSVIDGNDDEILSDLVHEQQRDLIREIAAFYTSGGDTPNVAA
ncbi:hypothetical protein FPV16_13155 [Methylobacterium sp. W2]|uniref:hypothetical protein n=1 Tax=Methylobacterium sp. W2 TaxID=2598107 RepID=UPI001D0C4378|nr:hypothetical protein [Methylobacterium sp. W2]MCC0807167.1 hypothetical protein [Methylobacterium sp. W2]